MAPTTTRVAVVGCNSRGSGRQYCCAQARGPDGYLIELQLFSGAGSGNKYLASRPIQVMLNNGLNDSECGADISVLITPSTVDTSQAQPGAGILIMSGY